MGKGENASPFPIMFRKGSFFGVVKSHDCVERVKILYLSNLTSLIFCCFVELFTTQSQLLMTLTLSQTTNFRLQTKRVCDNFKSDKNGRTFSRRVENTAGKEKLLVISNFSFSHSISPFPTVFSKGLYWRNVKTRAYLGKG